MRSAVVNITSPTGAADAGSPSLLVRTIVEWSLGLVESCSGNVDGLRCNNHICMSVTNVAYMSVV